MILLNTTFHVDNALVEPFLTWIKETYLPAAGEVEGLAMPVVARLLMEAAPGATSFAVQLAAANLAVATEWHDSEGAALRAEIIKKWGERVVFFTTYMEKMDL